MKLSTHGDTKILITYVVVFLIALVSLPLVFAASPNFLRNDITQLLTITGVAAVGDCGANEVVMNITTAGVECVTPSGAGDITGVTAGTGLTGGGGSGTVTLNVDDAYLQRYNDSGNSGDNMSWNKSYADTLYAPISLVALHIADNTTVWAMLSSNLAKTLTVNGTLNTVSTKLDNTNTTSNIENLNFTQGTHTNDTDILGFGYNHTDTLTGFYDDRYLTSQLDLYFYNDSDSFNSTYSVMNVTLPTGASAQINTFTGLGAGDTLIANRILSTLQLSLLQTGAYNQHTTINYTAGSRDVQLKSTIHQRLVNGSEIQIGNSPLSNVLTSGSYQQVIWTGTINTETQFSAGEYLVMKLIATVSGGGGAPTISLVVADETAARLDIGINPIDIQVNEADPHWGGNSSSVARTGNCAEGAFVMNTTTGGVQCLTPAGGGDITAVNTNDKYLLGGAASGAVSLTINESELNATCTALDTNTNETVRVTALESLHAADNTSIWGILNSNLAKILTVNGTLNTVSTKLDNTNKTSNIENLNFSQGAHTTDTNTNESARVTLLETLTGNINTTTNIENLNFTQGAHTTDTTYDNSSFDLSQIANTGNINVMGYNLTNVSYVVLDDGGLVYDNATHTIIE